MLGPIVLLGALGPAGCGGPELRPPEPPAGRTWRGINQGYLRRATSQSSAVHGSSVTITDREETESRVGRRVRRTPPARLSVGDVVTRETLDEDPR